MVISPEHSQLGKHSNLSDIILGGQDGLVNVLGVILGVAAATNITRIVIVAGLAATFAESISMGAVAYTSKTTARDERQNNDGTAEIIRQSITVCVSSLIGSLIPLAPFFLSTD